MVAEVARVRPAKLSHLQLAAIAAFPLAVATLVRDKHTAATVLFVMDLAGFLAIIVFQRRR